MSLAQSTRTAIQRKRVAPTNRLAAPHILLDGIGIAAGLRREDAGFESSAGRHQMTVFRRGPVTMIVFAFDSGGTLPEHSAYGLVTIHALGGALTVRTCDCDYALTAGMTAVLAPGVPHSVTAEESSEMLLTVVSLHEPVLGAA